MPAAFEERLSKEPRSLSRANCGVPVLTGCARLGEQPSASLTQTCVEAVVQEGHHNPLLVTATAWALAVLEVGPWCCGWAGLRLGWAGLGWAGLGWAGLLPNLHHE